MPAIIAPALIALAPELSVTLFGAGVTAVSAATILSYGIVAGVSIGAQIGINLLERKKQKSDPQITQFTIRQPMPTRVRAYGRCKLGGALFVDIATPVAMASLTRGIVHCEGPVDAIEQWYMNDTLSRAATSDSDLGGVNIALPWAFYLSMESRRGGDDNASICSLLTPYAWTGTQSGLCYTVIQCRQPVQPEKNFQYYYPNGVPAVRIVARCAKVFDPRDATQDWNDSSTWKWSRNPALIALDYLTFTVPDTAGIAIPRGMGLPKIKMNLASFTAFANMCDEPVPTVFGYDGNGNAIEVAGTEPRYSCDGAYTMGESPTEVLARILATCDGTLYTLSDGTVGIRGGQWTVPSVTIDDSMIISADFSQGNDKFSAFNQLKISITATNMDYQVVEGTPWDDLDDQDVNGVIAQDLAVPYVQSYSQARRLAKIDMAKGNPRWRYNSLVCTLAALNVLGEEFVHVTHSIAGIDEDFLVLGTKLMNGATIELQLASISADAYSFDPSLEDEAPPSTNGVVTPSGDLRTALVHILADGSTVDMGLASDTSFSLEDWGAASDTSHGDADLGLISA